MRAVMQDGTHFGTIPGTGKPSLFKAGSEKILSTFRIAIDPLVEDLSTYDQARYRVTCRATSQVTGACLGSGVGECSSMEEKYSYRGIVCEKEWDATPEDRRRVKFLRDGREVKQVRTNPADVANTVLKMAKKRAQIDVTLTVTAASDIFTQDIEDLPDEVREAVETPSTPASQPPKRKDAPAPDAAEEPGMIVTMVESFSGTGKTGKPYEKYTIHFSDGRKGSTFDKKIRDVAQALKDSGVPVVGVVEDKGGYPTITDLWAVGDADHHV
jgi:hypothetical protein